MPLTVHSTLFEADNVDCVPPSFEDPVFEVSDPAQNLPVDLFTIDPVSKHIVKVFSDDLSPSGPLGIYNIKYSADFSSGFLNGCQNVNPIADLSFTVNVVNNCPNSLIQIDPSNNIFQDLPGHSASHQIILDGESTVEWRTDIDIVTDSPHCGAITQELTDGSM